MLLLITIIIKLTLADVKEYFNVTKDLEYILKFTDQYESVALEMNSDYEINVSFYLVNKSHPVFTWNGTRLYKHFKPINGKRYIFVISTNKNHNVVVEISYYVEWDSFWWIVPTIATVIIFCVLTVPEIIFVYWFCRYLFTGGKKRGYLKKQCSHYEKV